VRAEFRGPLLLPGTPGSSNSARAHATADVLSRLKRDVPSPGGKPMPGLRIVPGLPILRICGFACALGLATPALEVRAQGDPSVSGVSGFLPYGGGSGGFVPYQPGPFGGIGVQPGLATSVWRPMPKAASASARPEMDRMRPRLGELREFLSPFRSRSATGMSPGMGPISGRRVSRSRDGGMGMGPTGRPPVGSYPFQSPFDFGSNSDRAPGMSM
jgi:hypothetical protein